jgi:two-component system response regulator DevR
MTEVPAISVLLVDDSELVRSGLKTLLTSPLASGRFHVVGEASSIATAVEAQQQHQADVVLLDIRLPDGNGFDACRKILQLCPKTHVLMLTSFIDEQLVYEAMSSGAHGYLLKEINIEAIYQAIMDVAAGKFILDPSVTARVLSALRRSPPGGTSSATSPNRFAQLSGQEKRILALVAAGKTNKEIGEMMSLSDKTIKNYLSHIFEKLQISKRSQAAALYAEKNLTGES